MGTPVMLTNVRISFPTLVAPKASAPGGPEKYGADLIIVPNSQDHKAFIAMVQKIAMEKWKEQAPLVMQMIQAERKLRCFGLGDERISRKTMKPYDGYPGMVYVSALSDTQPAAFDAKGAPIPDTNTMAKLNELRRIYGGCYVNAAVAPWCQDNKHGRAIRCELIAVQFAGPGEPFGEGRPDVTGLFGTVADYAPTTPAFAAGMPSFMSEDVAF